MTGIIDIGSNTIRLVIYENGKKIKNIGLRSDIIYDTQNGILSEKGIENLCNSILFLTSKAENIIVYALATEAIRVLSNKEEVKDKIFKKTGLEIEILSGEEEAECVYLGVSQEIKEKNGICIDLGGGSLESIIFENDEITNINSYSIGCKKIKKDFVKGEFPTDEEIKDIEAFIEENVKKYNSSGNMYIVGGTAKTALKIYNYIKGENQSLIKTTDFENILGFIKNTPTEKLKELFKNRYDNIAVGIIIMKKIAEIYEKNEVYIKKNGVREGYLIKKEMNN